MLYRVLLSRCLVAGLLSVLLFSSRAFAASDIRFTVSLPQPWTHYVSVEMRVSGVAGKTVDLAMPVWTPGSYLIREFERNVQEVRVSDANDRPLPVRKINKNTWRVDKGTATAFVVRYQVYANVLTVQQAEVNDSHAFWNNAALLMYLKDTPPAKVNPKDAATPKDSLLNPVTLTIQAPPDWRIATSLEPVTGTTNSFSAPNFDILYDSPVEVGTFTELTFQVKDKPHRIILTGKGNYNPDRLTAGVKRIVEVESEMMGDLPYNSYTFLVTLQPGGGGGLEHLSSTALLFPPYEFNTPGGYQRFLSLAAHEYFHLWNVKRIRPDALGPFDYSTENYTRLTWVAEGVTSYYGGIFVRRAGFSTINEYLQGLASTIARIEQTPGRKVQSIEDASFDAWIKYYRPDENAVNSQLSYYIKGEVVGMLLDLTIRQKTNGAKSLDDVLRGLYADFALNNRNYTPADFQKECESVAGGSLEPFFTDYVRGTRELDYDAILASVGLRLKRDSGGAAEPYLGARLSPDPLGVRIIAVPEETPAYDQRLSVGDVLLAIDGVRLAGVEFLNDRLREKKPGDTVTLTLFRGDQLKTMDIKLGGQVRPDFRILPVDNPTDDQKRLLKAWLGTDSGS
jgi:predicted metalloprotease with PDZ domain